MSSLTFASALRENQQEVLQRWLAAYHGHVAEDFEQMLGTPMGRAVAVSFLGLAVELMGSEEYQYSQILHRARQAAQDDAYRRTAVGFCLPDLVTHASSFRTALEETIFNHVSPNSAKQAEELRSAVMAINRFGDTLVAGEIAGYFAYRQFSEKDEGDGRAA